ncbi:MAG: hypothetical protein ACJ76J_14055 [Thermoanaerobaculia bacterium]
MWVVFRKSDGAVVGASADSEVDIEKDKALKEVVANLVDGGSPEQFDAVQVKDRQKVLSVTERALRGKAKVQPGKGGELEVVDNTPEESLLTVATNASQFHPVDKVALIPADGKAFLVVTLQKIDSQGKPMTRKTKDNEVIWLRINHGSLREDKDDNPQEIRSVTLASGTARFRIFSENAKRLARVEMLSENPDLRLGGLQVEFI